MTTNWYYNNKTGINFSHNTNGISKIIYSALKKKRIVYGGTKRAVRNFIHVKDAAIASVNILNNKYALIEKIGFGSYSSVWLTYCIHDNNYYAAYLLLFQIAAQENLSSKKYFMMEKKGHVSSYLLSFHD